MPSGDQSPWNSHPAASKGERLTKRLDSWKEIASHFNRSERTVRRWEENEGLPVHRLLHEKRGSVYAYSDELEAWWESRQSNNSVRAGPLNQELHEPELEGAFAETAKGDPDTFVPTLDVTSDTDGSGAEERSLGSRVPTQRRQVIFIICGLLAILGIIVVLTVGRFRSPVPQKASSAGVHSLAVLPFENLSGDTEQEYFADGMTAELITELAKISSIRVISRTSVMRYKRIRKPLRDIARDLNVDAVVEGEVLRSQNRVRVTTQLIDASTDRHLWAETYDRDLKEVLSLQGEVARTIASQIKVRLSPEEQSRLTPPPAVNAKAHEDYLKGLYHLHRNTEGDLHTAIEYFQQATEQDPNYASGFAGLANAYAYLSSTYRAPREVMPQAKAAALRALELDQNLAEAHAWLGFVSINFDWDAVTAEKELKRATELNPSYADAHAIYAWYLSGMGLHEQAIAEAKRAMQLDPFSRFTYGDLSWVLLMARRYDQALLESQTVVERQPDFGYARAVLGLSYAENGRYPEAVRETQSATRLDDSPLMLTLLVQVHALARNRSEAMKVLQDMEQLTKKHYVCSYEVATGYVLLGEKGQAFRWFDKAVEERSDCMVALAVDPRLDGLRSDPRFQDLQRRVGLRR